MTNLSTVDDQIALGRGSGVLFPPEPLPCGEQSFNLLIFFLSDTKKANF